MRKNPDRDYERNYDRVKPPPTVDLLKLYFENKWRSGGKDVKNIQRKDETAIVTFAQHEGKSLIGGAIFYTVVNIM